MANANKMSSWTAERFPWNPFLIGRVRRCEFTNEINAMSIYPFHQNRMLSIGIKNVVTAAAVTAVTAVTDTELMIFIGWMERTSSVRENEKETQ